jgi:HK97 family phage major capsid protein
MLKTELKGILDAARVICDRAMKDRREFTSTERVDVEQYLAKAREIRDQLEAPEPRKSHLPTLEELNELFGEESATADLWSKAGKAGDWGAAFEKALRGRSPYESKAIMEPSGSVGVPGIIDGLTPLGDRVETILQLIPWKRLSGTDAISYLLEIERTHRAAPVATGDTKPTSTYTVERVDDRVRTIAHLSEPIPRQYLADIGLLRDYVGSMLVEGYQLELESQIIQGSGLGENFLGLLNTPLIQMVHLIGDVIQTARRAITALEVQSIAPTAFCFNPEDWERFELVTETGGAYLLRDGTNVVPVDRARRRLWGYPVALSVGVPEGTGLLVDFQGSTQGWEREQVRLDWSEAFHVPATAYDEDATSGFERNLVRFRCEGRAGFAVKRPRGVVQIELDGS